MNVDPNLNIQGWVPKALEDIDAALGLYAVMRHELNRDGQGEARARHVDDMLDRRMLYAEHLRSGAPLDAE